MQLVYGSAVFDAGSTLLTSRIDNLWNEGGQLYEQRVTFCVKGFLSGNGQAACDALQLALENALAIPYQDLKFYNDVGGLTSESLLNATSITGARITDGPNFDSEHGAEFNTVRHFTFTAESSYPVKNSASLLLSFTETLEFAGGGPLYVCRPALNGPSQRQMTFAAMPYRVIQHGSAVGYRGYPNYPTSKWPFALKQSGDFSPDTPKRRGKGFTDFAIKWRFEHEYPTPLAGVPTVWIQ